MRKLLSALLIALLLPTSSLAATSYDVHNLPQMHLNASILSTATTGIKLVADPRNGTNITIPTTSGAIFRFTQGSKVEDIYAASATVNATTGVMTLAGVIRDVCFNQARTIVGCGNGQFFSKGATVQLSVAAQLLNLKANIDRSNTFTARDGIRFSGSGSLGQPTFATTAIRDQQLGASPASGSGLVACVVATGLCYDGLGGAWVARGANAVQNADTGVSGKVEIPTIAHMKNLTGTGSSGAQNVVPLRWLVKNGTGSVSAGRVPTLNQNGALNVSVGGTGLTTASGVLIGTNQGALGQVQATASGQVLMSNAAFVWRALPLPGVVLKRMSVVEKITPSTGDNNFTNTLTIPANTLATGSILRLVATGTGLLLSGGPLISKHALKLGTTEMCRSNAWQAPSSPQRGWKIDATLTVLSTGATGKLLSDCDLADYDNQASARSLSGSTVTINTTTSNTVNVVYTNTTGWTGRAWLNQLFVQFFQ